MSTHASDFIRALGLDQDDGKVQYEFRTAMIASTYILSSGWPTLLFDGESTVGTRQYPCIGGYIPAANDRVMVLLRANSGLILGKIPDPSTISQAIANVMTLSQLYMTVNGTFLFADNTDNTNPIDILRTDGSNALHLLPWGKGAGSNTTIDTVIIGAGGGTANFQVNGSYTATGTKSAVVETSQGETLLYSVESPEVRFEDYGEGTTDATGQATITLDPLFMETIDTNSGDYQVYIQGIDSSDLVVPTRDPSSFVVKGSPNARFMYRVLAWRKGFTGKRFNAAAE